MTAGAPTRVEPRLTREAFKTSRMAEFATVRELVTQTGTPVDRWPTYIQKELTDNGIDIAEERGIAPVISVEISAERGEMVVTDNGAGIAPEVVDSILDYTTRTSSRAGYVSPSRGQQGNALQTIIAMPFALDPGIGETAIIESREVAHRISFKIDPVSQEPRISCVRATSPVKIGSKITVHWPGTASHILYDAKDRFLPLSWDYVGLNPHLALSLAVGEDDVINWDAPTNPEWEKWGPADPIPAHWYTPETLQRLIAAQVNLDREHGKRVRPVRDFVADFRGLSGTGKLSAVLGKLGLSRAPLDVFFDGDQVDRPAIGRLLLAMQEHSRAVKPEALGVIGEQHFRDVFETDGADQDRFRYARILGEDKGLPFIVEAAFAPTAELSPTPLVSGVNWSAAIRDPFQSLGVIGHSLGQVLLSRHVTADDALVVGMHLASPAVNFLDRGKSSLVLGPSSGNAVAEAVQKVTKSWVADWDAKQRARYRSARATARALEAEERKKRQHQRELDRKIDELLATENDAEREAKRQRSAIVGTGTLHAEIAAAAEELGVPIAELLVLSKGNDPYFRDTREGHANGQWLADQVARFIPQHEQVHLRGLFYLIVSAADVKRPDGPPLVNDDECWRLVLKAAKAARWLDRGDGCCTYVPFERIRDARNDRPIIITLAPGIEPAWSRGTFAELPEPPKVEHFVAPFVDVLPRSTLPGIDEMLPKVELVDFDRRQPYRIILFGEKTSLAPVLRPLAYEYNTELILPTGESTDTYIFEMAQRAAEDDRPAILLYFSDFDPSGYHMPTSVSRKLQAFKTLRFPTLDIRVYRVALTIQQVREYGLPSTPLKHTEGRAARWKARWGHEQTEVDALAAVRPEILRDITTEWILRFYDPDLAKRVENARAEYLAKADARLREHPRYEELRQAISEANKAMDEADRGVRQKFLRAIGRTLARLEPELRGAHEQVARVFHEFSKYYDRVRQELDEVELPEIEIPEPEIDKTGQPDPLFNSGDDFITATRKLLAAKALDDEGGT